MSFLRFPRVFGRFGLGFRWCLSFSHPLPTRPIFVFVFWRPNLFWDMSFLRFPRVLGRFGLGFRWCLSFSHPLPTKPIFVFVQARLSFELWAPHLVPLHQNCIRRQKSLHQQKLNRLYHFSFFSKSSQTLPSSTEWSKAHTLTMIAARACKLVFVLKSVHKRKGCSKEGPPPRFNLVFQVSALFHHAWPRFHHEWPRLQDFKCFKPTSFWESPHLILTSFCRRPTFLQTLLDATCCRLHRK